MHGVWYRWLIHLIGDGDSSVYHTVVSGLPSYGIPALISSYISFSTSNVFYMLDYKFFSLNI